MSHFQTLGNCPEDAAFCFGQALRTRPGALSVLRFDFRYSKELQLKSAGNRKRLKLPLSAGLAPFSRLLVPAAGLRDIGQSAGAELF